jgi:hypothetical protein
VTPGSRKFGWERCGPSHSPVRSNPKPENGRADDRRAKPSARLAGGTGVERSDVRRDLRIVERGVRRVFTRRVAAQLQLDRSGLVGVNLGFASRSLDDVTPVVGQADQPASASAPERE